LFRSSRQIFLYRSTKPSLRWRWRQTAIVTGATDKRLEKQPTRNRKRDSNIDIGEGPTGEVDSTPELKPRQQESPIARHSKVKPGRQDGPVDVNGVTHAVIEHAKARFKSVRLGHNVPWVKA
jgi:hypothetical protein